MSCPVCNGFPGCPVCTPDLDDDDDNYGTEPDWDNIRDERNENNSTDES